MRCNSCWQELEGRAIVTTCGHVLCPEDANKILSNCGACPICDQVLSKSLMKLVEINPNDEWVNMAMAGVTPQICILNIGDELVYTVMKSAYRSVSFYIGQRDLEMQYKMNKIVAQCRQKCETMQEKCREKLEQVYTAYQKMTQRCQMLEQERENLSKDKLELQEKFAEKCRQKRKLDEMYDLARTEVESLKRSTVQPVNHSFSIQEPDLFSNPETRMDNRVSIRTDWSVLAPNTPGQREDMWSERQNPHSTFSISGDTPTRPMAVPVDHGNRKPSVGVGRGNEACNPSMTLRNLILSPIKRPQLSRSRPQLFTL